MTHEQQVAVLAAWIQSLDDTIAALEAFNTANEIRR